MEKWWLYIALVRYRRGNRLLPAEDWVVVRDGTISIWVPDVGS
jgi:hypothetical protein